MPWLLRMQGTRGKHAAMFSSVRVGLHACKTIVSLQMKIWERFCLKSQVSISNETPNCLPLVSMDARSPTPWKYDYHIHSLYFFGIRFRNYTS